MAWRIGCLGRSCPQWNAERLLMRKTWQVACMVAGQEVPEKTPTLRSQVLHMIARPGGFIGRKGDGEPGVKSLTDRAGAHQCH